VLLSVELLVDFTHGHQVRQVKIRLGWFLFPFFTSSSRKSPEFCKESQP
jgi:hypothetical protein